MPLFVRRTRRSIVLPSCADLHASRARTLITRVEDWEDSDLYPRDQTCKQGILGKGCCNPNAIVTLSHVPSLRLEEYRDVTTHNPLLNSMNTNLTTSAPSGFQMTRLVFVALKSRPTRASCLIPRCSAIAFRGARAFRDINNDVDCFRAVHLPEASVASFFRLPPVTLHR